MEQILAIKLKNINKQIEILKKNTIKNIEEESMIEATADLLMMRDLKEQQLLIRKLLKTGD